MEVGVGVGVGVGVAVGERMGKEVGVGTVNVSCVGVGGEKSVATYGTT